MGRERELVLLGDVLRRVRQGGQIVVVEGEAGIGKSRLIGAALDTARSARATVLNAGADELDAHRPFAAILDLSPPGDQTRWRDPIVDAMTVSEPGLDVEGERSFRVAETVLELLERECMRGPVVVAVEDLHWADPATVGVLAQVARAIANLPVALVVSARPAQRRHELERLLAQLQSRRAVAMTLGPLDDAACAELVAELVGAPPGPRLLRQARGAAGNPLFVTELIGTLEADGVIVREDGQAEVALAQEMPPLPMTILHRLSFLDAETLELLGLASVLGTTFTAADLALMTDRHVAQLVSGLQSARRAGVLAEAGDRLAFRHALIRDALYEDMAVSVRRALHGAFARALADAGEPPERLTEHLLRAASPGDPRSIAALTRTGRELVSRAPSASVDLFRAAISLSADPDAARMAILPELAQAMVSAGQLADGEAACREAIARGVDPETESRLRLQLVMLLTRRPRTGAAVREAKAGLTAPGLTERGRERLRAWLALARVFEGAPDTAVRDAEAVLGSSQDDLARALALDALALTANLRGRFAEAADLMAESARQAEAIGSREAFDSCPHMILGLQLARLDRLDEAAAAIQRGRRASEGLGMLDTLASFHYQLALVDWLRGRIDDALAELATHEDYAEQTGAGWSVPADSLRALVALHRGDLLAAETHVGAAEAAAAAGAPQHQMDLMVLARARVLDAGGDRAAAFEVTAAAFGMAERAGAATYFPVLGPELARLAAQTGQAERAATVSPALDRIAELNPGAASLRAAALQARGWLDGDPGPLVEAATEMRRSGRVLEAARAAQDAAAALGPDDADAARELLEAARRAYEASGAGYDLARVEAALRGLGSRRGVRGPRHRPKAGWDALTDTELRVVRLVAERLTNPEIAERLFISRRTVQTHVSHALAKLGVSSRRELAAEAARRAGWRIRFEGPGEDAEQGEPAGERTAGSAVNGHDA